MSGYREQIGVLLNDQLSYEIIGKRQRGSFRAALRAYGFEKKEIDQIIDDIDCDRDAIIQRSRYRYQLRAL